MPWHKHNDAEDIANSHAFGGIRSYSLLALLGGITTWLDSILATNVWKIL
jgi:hypothetical protein